jgi:hypothetical protein
MPLCIVSDDAGRHEVRITGRGVPGPRTEWLAWACPVAGAMLAIGHAAEVRDHCPYAVPRDGGTGALAGVLMALRRHARRDDCAPGATADVG